MGQAGMFNSSPLVDAEGKPSFLQYARMPGKIIPEASRVKQRPLRNTRSLFAFFFHVWSVRTCGPSREARIFFEAGGATTTRRNAAVPIAKSFGEDTVTRRARFLSC